MKSSMSSSLFEDAVSVWHMADLNSSAGRACPLTAYGDVRLGVALRDDERAMSLARGGDGVVAEFHGGWLDAGQGPDGALNLKGRMMTIHLRVRVTGGSWRAPLLSKHGGTEWMSYHLYGRAIGSAPTLREWDDIQNYHAFSRPEASEDVLEFELGLNPVGLDPRRDTASGELRTGVPLAMVGEAAWHDITVRFTGPNLGLFVDGVLLDEEWPFGDLRQSPAPCLIGAAEVDGKVRSGFHGQVDHVALWNRALLDEEINFLSGGEEVARRDREILGPQRSGLQYWKPRGHNTWAGDTMLACHDGKLHLLWLFDRRHNKSRWGTGAHQIAHASTTDLVSWQHHPMAVPTEEQWQCIGTGSMIHHDRMYRIVYGLHTNRVSSEFPIGADIAVSEDGVHFTKQKTYFKEGGEYLAGAVNPFVFFNEESRQFQAIVARSRYVSTDLRNWTLADAKFLGENRELVGEFSGECPCHFEWNGWHYIIMGKTGFWMSRRGLGPYWKSSEQVRDVTVPRWDIYDGLMVPEAARFGDRCILAGWLLGLGWASQLVFRELIQHEDGTLGMKWPEEMIPRTGTPQELTLRASAKSVRWNDGSLCFPGGEGFVRFGSFEAGGDIHITTTVRPKPDAACFGLCVKGSDNYRGGCELQFDPSRRRAQWGTPVNGIPAPDSHGIPYHAGDFAIEQVDKLDRPFRLDVMVVEDRNGGSTIIDACIDNRRTMITRRKDLDGDRLFFFATGGEVCFENLTVRPLRREDSHLEP